MCNQQLDQETSCHLFRNKVICRQDYLKLQREDKLDGRKLAEVKCSRCKSSIGAEDWVRRAGSYVYHLACFSCDICLRQLNTGDQFTLSANEEKNYVRLLCKLHFVINNETTASLLKDKCSSRTNATFGLQDYQTDTEAPNAVIGQEQGFYNNDQRQQQQYLHMLASTSASVKKQQNDCSGFHADHQEPTNHMMLHSDELPSQNQAFLRTSGLHLSQRISLNSNSSPTSSSSSVNASNLIGMCGVGGSSLSSKSKRVRTTFTEDQLAILQDHFQRDSNPDGQDLERIATITGLSKRVTQVWFQNSRARQKKYMIKRKPGSGSNHQMAACAMADSTGLATNRPTSTYNDQGAIEESGGDECNTNYTHHVQKWSANVSERSELSFDANFHQSSPPSSNENVLIISDDELESSEADDEDDEDDEDE